MTVVFFDLQESSNPLNALRITNKIELDETLEKLRSREPFIFKLVGENGYKLDIGIGPKIGCVQHSPSGGNTPYLMAVAPGEQDADDYVEFLLGDTATPVSKRYCMPREQVKEIAAYFVETGDRSPNVSWEEI